MKKWKDIPGFEGLYEASTSGEIRSIKRVVYNGVANHVLKERILKPIPNGTGYFGVCLRKDNCSKRMYVHRLVAMAFLRTKNYLLEVNHIDGNRANNNVLNLEWVTRSENHFHRYKTLKQKGVNEGKTGALNWRSKPVNMINMQNEVVKKFPGVMEAARQLKVNESSIRCALYGRSKTCLGYKWEYATDPLPWIYYRGY